MQSTGITYKGQPWLLVGVVSMDIFLYNEGTGEWLVIGGILTPRFNCLAEVVGNELVVVGGWLDHCRNCDIIFMKL